MYFAELSVSCVYFPEHFSFRLSHDAQDRFVFDECVDDGDGSFFGDPEACAWRVDDFTRYLVDFDVFVLGECASECLYELFVSLSGKFECAAVVFHSLYV